MKASTLAVALAVLGAAAPALAVDLDNGTIACGTEPTYYPRGDFWSVIRGTGAPTAVPYRIHAGGLDSIPGDTENSAIQRSFDTWMAVRCNGEVPNLRLERGTDYENRDNGDEYDGDALVLDTAQNIVFFVTTAADWEVDQAIVAYTNNLASEAGPIVTADMQINGVDYQWRAANAAGVSSGCAKPAQGAASTCYDVGNTVLHEAGHFIGLNHVQCTDAVMYPSSTPTTEIRQLSVHETTAICNLYPPRDAAGDQPTFGEACDFNGGPNCQAGLTCVVGPEFPEASGWGNCTYLCNTTDECPTAYVCDGAAPNKFCRPGLHDTGSTIDPTTGGDSCIPCVQEQDCANGLCVAGEEDDTGYCSETCSADFPCPAGFSCLQAGDISVCWPDDEASCGLDDARIKLNEVCYNDDPDLNTGTNDGFYYECGTSLICVGFRGSSCLPSIGACVYYCNATDQSYSGQRCPDPNQDCCYGVTELGACRKVPDDNHQQGGCFTVRKVGETCVTAENAICQDNAKCIYAGNNAGGALCYGLCSSSVACNPNETCFTTNDNCGDPLSFCCDTAVYNRTGECLPYGVNNKRELGVECSTASECQSGICYNFNGKSSCSRRCNIVTGAGCPGNIDVNGDAKSDGGFYCAETSDEGWCWPKEGPARFLGTGENADEGGGCAASGGGASVVALLAMLVIGRRRSVVGRR